MMYFVAHGVGGGGRGEQMRWEGVEVEVMAKEEQLRLDHDVFMESWCIPLGSLNHDSNLYFYNHVVFMKS